MQHVWLTECMLVTLPLISLLCLARLVFHNFFWSILVFLLIIKFKCLASLINGQDFIFWWHCMHACILAACHDLINYLFVCQMLWIIDLNLVLEIILKFEKQDVQHCFPKVMVQYIFLVQNRQ